MSRGLGSVQRRVLEVLRERGRAPDAHSDSLPVPALVAVIYGPTATRAETESVRRAVRSLDDKGHITTRRVTTVTASLATTEEQPA